MTRSMTGFGKAARDFDGEIVTVELNAVNHRVLDCAMHLPNAWSALEAIVKDTIRQQVTRGRVNVWIGRKRRKGINSTIRFDQTIAEQYVSAAQELEALLEKKDGLSVNVLAQLDGVFYQEDPEEDLEQAEAVVLDTLREALVALNRMRAKEGMALAKELRHRIDLLRTGLATIEARLPELKELYEQRLRTRLEELNAETQVTEDRLAVEIAMMAEKSDVTEEVVRFKTHLVHAEELLDQEDPSGRELNFLTQELQREVNTLSSKVRDSDVSREVMRMKAELEKFREQTQNIE